MTLEKIKEIYYRLRDEKKKEFHRSLSFGDYFTDRWERARHEGFGEGTSVYDNVLILGDVVVGENTWIGPHCVLDGSGGRLEIGDYCSISSGVQIYTHNTVQWSNTMGEAEYDTAATKIGDGVYLGPNSVIQMGVNIGNKAIIGAMSFVNKDVPDGAKVFGCPAKTQDKSEAA